MNGVGQLIFAIEAGGGGVAIGGIIHGIAADINIFIAYQAIASAAIDDHAVLIQLGRIQIIAVQEGRLQVGIHRFHRDVVRQIRIPIQQSGNGRIFIARNHQQVQFHILLQRRHNASGLVRQFIQRIGCQVNFRGGAGKAAHQQIGDNGNHNHDHRSQSGPTASNKALAEELLHPRLLFLMAHSFHLRFSMDCTVRNRNTQMMER